MPDTPILFGLPYSVYTRIARLAFAEKAVTYTLRETDVFAASGSDASYRERHPFGRIPALDHNGFRLYETGAIARYIDEAFDGPALQPADARSRARMNQIIGILDSYAYRCWVWDIFVERIRRPMYGEASDEQFIHDALPLAQTCLSAIVELMADNAFLTGEKLSLADTHAGPMMEYLVCAPEGRALLDKHDRLAAWWERMRARPSMIATRPPSSFMAA